MHGKRKSLQRQIRISKYSRFFLIRFLLENLLPPETFQTTEYANNVRLIDVITTTVVKYH